MESPCVPRLVLASPSSGQGKTTVTAALLRALTTRGLRTAPFKVGPDFVDPTHHTRAAGRPSRNLDGWLLPHPTVLSLFHRATTGEHAADVAVIEGVMGLFDGHSATTGDGSTAELALLLRAPVVLVLDASAMARTAAAVVHGLHTFDPSLRLAGVVLNRVAGERHYQICRDAILAHTDVSVLGWLPRDPALAVPERHLGLVLAAEHPMDLGRLAAQIERTVDVDALLAIARTAPPLPLSSGAGVASMAGRSTTPRPVIAVARDTAFDFYYEDNLDILRDVGAELREWSPLADATLPHDAGALYIGGGYPELHAARLAANAPMHEAIRAFARTGRPIYAECGGLMYLADAFIDAQGMRLQMVGLVPGTSRMTPRVTLGYRELVAARDSCIAVRGQAIRGHEFHYSALEIESPSGPAYRRVDDTRVEGIVGGPSDNVLASYVHIHFGTDPGLAERFVKRAGAARDQR